MSDKNEVFEYLIDQLRQQVSSNQYKQQCEDLAHEVLSLKNQLRDASVQIKELHMALAEATGDVEAYKLIRKGGYVPEQSGCRKDDTQECEHEWRCVVVFGNRLGAPYCRKCGVAKPEECKHDWYFYDKGASMMCIKCGLKK